MVDLQTPGTLRGFRLCLGELDERSLWGGGLAPCAGDICVYARYKDWLCSKDQRLKEVGALGPVMICTSPKWRFQWFFEDLVGLKAILIEIMMMVMAHFQTARWWKSRGSWSRSHRVTVEKSVDSGVACGNCTRNLIARLGGWVGVCVFF